MVCFNRTGCPVESLERRFPVIWWCMMYDENLAVLSLPTIRLLLDDTSREYYNKILYSNDHPLHHIIQPNQCTLSLRVRRMSYTPVCRTTKYANCLFIKYAHWFYHFYFFNLFIRRCVTISFSTFSWSYYIVSNFLLYTTPIKDIFQMFSARVE